jgi:hypothetical protein
MSKRLPRLPAAVPHDEALSDTFSGDWTVAEAMQELLNDIRHAAEASDLARAHGERDGA